MTAPPQEDIPDACPGAGTCQVGHDHSGDEVDQQGREVQVERQASPEDDGTDDHQEHLLILQAVGRKRDGKESDGQAKPQGCADPEVGGCFAVLDGHTGDDAEGDDADQPSRFETFWSSCMRDGWPKARSGRPGPGRSERYPRPRRRG